MFAFKSSPHGFSTAQTRYYLQDFLDNQHDKFFYSFYRAFFEAHECALHNQDSLLDISVDTGKQVVSCPSLSAISGTSCYIQYWRHIFPSSKIEFAHFDIPWLCSTSGHFLCADYLVSKGQSGGKLRLESYYVIFIRERLHFKRRNENINVVSLFSGKWYQNVPGLKISRYDNITYMNSGDWVESLSALVEDYFGNWKIVYYSELADENTNQDPLKEANMPGNRSTPVPANI